MPWKNSYVGSKVKDSCLLEQSLASVDVSPDPRQMEDVSYPAALQRFLLQDPRAKSNWPQQRGKSQSHRFPQGWLGSGIYVQAAESEMPREVTSLCRGGVTGGPGQRR